MLARGGVHENPAAEPRGQLVGSRDVRRCRERPAAGPRADGRLGALECPGANLAHRLLDEGPGRLGRPVHVVDPRLPSVVVVLVGDMEDQEPTNGWLAGSHLERRAVVRRLHAFAYRLGRRRLAATVEAAL